MSDFSFDPDFPLLVLIRSVNVVQPKRNMGDAATKEQAMEGNSKRKKEKKQK
jgi:hypothetical protein